MKKKIWLLFTILLVFVFTAKADNPKRKLFESISINEGLSQSTVLDIIQDSNGYMWFATQDGLNRYDGYEFKTFRREENESGAISSQYLRRLYVDSEGTLWIGGDKGVSRYDAMYEEFKNYDIFEDGEDTYISGIVGDKNNRMWLSAYNGDLYLLDKDSDSFERVKYSTNEGHIGNLDALESIDSLLYVGTESGLYIFNKDNLSFRKVQVLKSNISIGAIKADPVNGIWVGTEGDGLILIDKNNTLLSHYENQAESDNCLVNNVIRDIEIDSEGNLWIGTIQGLSILDLEDGVFINYQEDYTTNFSLSHNSIRSIFMSEDGGVWLGTFYGGLNYYYPESIKFTLINRLSGPLSLSDNVISGIAEDHNGNIWIGTNDHGLIYWDLKNQKMIFYPGDPNDPNKLSSNNIKSILVLDDNSLLIGTHLGGLNHFYPDKKPKVYSPDTKPGSLAHNNVYTLLKDHVNQIWIGTFRGLQQFDPDEGIFTTYYIDSKGNRLTSDEITYLFEDSRNKIWIGTDDGLNIILKDRNNFISYRYEQDDTSSISGNRINCIAEDSKGRIWIGTNSGLSLFDEVNNSFKRFSRKNGLPNNVIYGILEDDELNLWISSNAGLTRFNPDLGSFQNFTIEDGIQSSQFNNYSFAKTSDGKMLFGGINGITAFYPDEIGYTAINKKVIITQLSINNNLIRPHDKTGILDNHIGNTSTISIKKQYNSFSLKFVAINFLYNNKINYLYKLEGFNDDWTQADNSRKISFSNLDPGEYLLQLKVDLGPEDDEELITKIQIIILSPWWATDLALIIYFILAAVIGIIVFLTIRYRIRTIQSLKIARMEKQQLLEVNNMKLQFFTNISHEFKTPLTLIISPLEKLIESRTKNHWYNKQIDLVYKNARRLLTLIDQLMEFRKAEMGQVKLKVVHGDIIEFLDDLYLSFTSLASARDIMYTIDKNVEKLDILFDREIIEKIVFNLLSNAFKYTPSGGNIELKINKSEKYVTLTVNDSGKGIPKDQQSLIFERFYSTEPDNPSVGSGIGLAFTKRLVELHHGIIELKSEPGKGSTFNIHLPLYRDVYPSAEIFERSTSEVIDHGQPIELEEEIKYNLAENDNADEKDRILIVDDNLEILNYLYENLSFSYDVDTANDGLEALDKVKDREYELILSDVMMPKMDGLTFCKKIKQNIKTCHIPFILLTVKASIDDQVEGHETGADDYLGKPFSLRVLESKINNLIKSRKRLKKIYAENIDFNAEEVTFNILDQEFLTKALNVVENHLSDHEFSIGIFAKEMFISRSNMHLKFKAITGESASEFIKKIRFRQAIELLKIGKHNISEISYMVGFTSPSYFSSRFKKYFGYLPTDYRKNR